MRDPCLTRLPLARAYTATLGFAFLIADLGTPGCSELRNRSAGFQILADLLCWSISEGRKGLDTYATHFGLDGV